MTIAQTSERNLARVAEQGRAPGGARREVDATGPAAEPEPAARRMQIFVPLA